MIRNFLILLAILVIGFAVNSCQRDDICPEATQTTPLLIIRFYDIDEPDALKPVNDLSVRGEGIEGLAPLLDVDGAENDTIIRTDSIAIPLNTAAMLTELIFTRNTNDTIDEDNENRDSLQFSYTPEDEYINRACSFRTNFLDLELSFDFQDEDNWIQDIDIIQPNVTDELTAHIFIFH